MYSWTYYLMDKYSQHVYLSETCCPHSAFAFISNTLVKTPYEKAYYNLHNELWIPFCIFFFLLHADIKTAFTDYDNHSERDFYELQEFRCPILSFNGNQALRQNTSKQVCLCSSVIAAK